MNRPLIRYALLIVFLAVASIACNLVSAANVPTATIPAAATPVQVQPTSAPTDAPASTTANTEPPAPTQPSANTNLFSFNNVSFILPPEIAQSAEGQVKAAVPPSNDAPPWDIAPEHVEINLKGYALSDTFHQPALYIWPAQEFQSTNEGAAQVISELADMLKNHPGDAEHLPFLPVFNAAQVFHARMLYLNFQTGSGIHYLTAFAQNFMVINNHELVYTFQGLTSDGKYYVAAVLPIAHPSLPATGDVTGKEPPEFTQDYPKYLQNVAQELNLQPANSFIPSLDILDQMMSSLKITP